MLRRCRGDRHRPSRRPRRRAGRPRAARRCRRAARRSRARATCRARCAGPVWLQVREPPAHGLVQDPRGVQRASPASTPPSARGGWSRRARATTRRASRSPPEWWGSRATVFMPIGAALPKVAATKGYGAEVRLEGHTVDESLAAAHRFAAATGAVLVHPFDHVDVMAGQGTVGLEILEQVPDVRTVLVCTGGGGLLGGVAAAVKGCGRTSRWWGCRRTGAAAWPVSLAEGGAGDAAVDAHDRRRHRRRPPGRRHVRAGGRAGRRHPHGGGGRAVPRAAALPGAREARGGARGSGGRWRR